MQDLPAVERFGTVLMLPWGFHLSSSIAPAQAAADASSNGSCQHERPSCSASCHCCDIDPAKRRLWLRGGHHEICR